MEKFSYFSDNIFTSSDNENLSESSKYNLNNMRNSQDDIEENKKLLRHDSSVFNMQMLLKEKVSQENIIQNKFNKNYSLGDLSSNNFIFYFIQF